MTLSVCPSVRTRSTSRTRWPINILVALCLKPFSYGLWRIVEKRSVNPAMKFALQYCSSLNYIFSISFKIDIWGIKCGFWHDCSGQGSTTLVWYVPCHLKLVELSFKPTRIWGKSLLTMKVTSSQVTMNFIGAFLHYFTRWRWTQLRLYDL